MRLVEEPQRPKRTFPELVQAIYADRRVGHEARELLLAVAYAVDLAHREDDRTSPLRTARKVLGRDRIGRPRYDALVAADAPRYEPPSETADWHPAAAPTCRGPRLRPYKPRPYKPRTPPSELAVPEPVPLRPLPLPVVHVPEGYRPPRDWRTEDGLCGATSHHRVLERDPETGWMTAHWFCKRHHEHAERVAEQVRDQNGRAPEPVPNTGGLLPVFFAADWETVYRRYRPGWTPPSYGICADGWLVPGAPSVRRGRLRALSTTGSPIGLVQP
ncbi:hypothetical protein [Streptomyces sp. NPDC001205]